MLSVVSCTSLMGTRSRARRVPTVRCVSGSKERIDSSVVDDADAFWFSGQWRF